MNGLGSQLVSARKRLMAACRSATDLKTPPLRCCLVSLAKKPLKRWRPTKKPYWLAKICGGPLSRNFPMVFQLQGPGLDLRRGRCAAISNPSSTARGSISFGSAFCRTNGEWSATRFEANERNRRGAAIAGEAVHAELAAVPEDARIES